MSKTQRSTKQDSNSQKTRTTSDALEIIDKTIVGDNRELRDFVEEATVNAMVAGAIYDARTEANLTQTELADLIGTKQPVISQLENADYEGHSLTMLKRIGKTYEEEVEMTLEALISLIEPFMICFLAVVIGTIVLALFLPMVKLIENLSGGG